MPDQGTPSSAPRNRRHTPGYVPGQRAAHTKSSTHDEAIDETGVTAADRLTWTVEEAAAVLGVSVSYYYKAIKQQKLPAMRLGRRLVVPKQALRDFVSQTEKVAS